MGEDRKRKKRSILEILRGKKVVIQAIGGIIYEGILSGKDGDYYILKQAVVKGKNKIAHVDFVAIKEKVIQHIHLEPKVLEDVTVLA